MYPHQESLDNHLQPQIASTIIILRTRHSTHILHHPASTSYTIYFYILPCKPGSEQMNNNGTSLSAGLTATLEIRNTTILSRRSKPFSSYRDAVRQVTVPTLSLYSNLYTIMCVVCANNMALSANNMALSQMFQKSDQKSFGMRDISHDGLSFFCLLSSYGTCY